MLIPRPLHVHIDPFYDPDMTASGLLHIPDSNKGRSTQGIIKYVGNKVTYVKPGDYVLFNGYVGETISFPDEGVLIDTHQRNLVAIIDSAEFYDLSVSGLYHLDKLNNPFQATVNSTLQLLKDTIQKNSSIRSSKNNDKRFNDNLDITHDLNSFEESEDD